MRLTKEEAIVLLLGSSPNGSLTDKQIEAGLVMLNKSFIATDFKFKLYK